MISRPLNDILLLRVEHDCSKVFVSAGCIPQEVLYTPPCRGVRGGLVPPMGVWRGRSPPRLGAPGTSDPPAGLGGSAPEAKNSCKIAL